MEEKHSKNLTSISLIILAVFAVLAFIALLIYSKFEDKESNETQNRYHSEIKNIEKYLSDGNCTEAVLEYDQAKVTRHDIEKRGLYYSFYSHAKEAHVIGIAECFANKKEFTTAVRILDSEAGDDPDSLLKASAIYISAGELAKAQEAQRKAAKY